ncbi:hypothetical protein AAG570_004989 [Ranatra chinensis]|uniref:Pre-C2HC domain-containing protein n=1 Tax=Ranatra chinensis TaxID=642074 RepID=A0ABD0Y022_9HEMI
MREGRRSECRDRHPPQKNARAVLARPKTVTRFYHEEGTRKPQTLKSLVRAVEGTTSTCDRPPARTPLAYNRSTPAWRPRHRQDATDCKAQMATAQDIRSIFDPVEETEMEFTLVQGKRRRPRKSSLSDSSSDDESTQTKKYNKPDSAAQTTATRKIATKACKIPPITVFPKGIRMIEINSAFVKECKPESLKTIKTKDGTRMYTKNSKDYVSLQNFLERKGIPHIIFKLKDDRPVKYVIRGVDDETLPEELLAELKSEGLPAIRVAQLKSGGDKRKLPLFLIEFHPAVDKNKVNGITNIFGMGVRIEPYKTPKTPLQCHNCQRLGHGAQCCSAERRCVKCGLNHLAKECNKTKEEFYCALCGGNHAASYRGCPTYKNRLANKQRNVSSTGKGKSNTETQVKKPQPKKTVGTGQTYAVVASNAHHNTPPQTVEPAPETAPPQAPPIPEPPKPQRPPVPKPQRPKSTKPQQSTKPPHPPKKETQAPIENLRPTSSWQDLLMPLLRILNPKFTWEGFLPRLVPLIINLLTNPTSITQIFSNILDIIRSVNE